MNQQSRMILAIVLSMGIMFGYQAFFAPPPAPPAEDAQAAVQDTAPTKEAPPVVAERDPAEPVQQDQPVARHTIRGEKLSIDLSNGSRGLIEHVHLLEPRFQDEGPDGEPVGHDVLNLESRATLGLAVERSRSDFDVPRGNAQVVESDDKSLTLRRSGAQVDITQRIELIGGYEAKYTVAVHNRGSAALSYAWLHDMRMGVVSTGNSRADVFRILCGSAQSNEDVDSSDLQDDGETTLPLEEPLRWAGVDAKFFLGALVAPKPWASCKARPEEDGAAIAFSAMDRVLTVEPGETQTQTLGLYFGPKSTQWLENTQVVQDVSLSSAVDWGWFGGLSKALGSLMLRLLRWFHTLTGNWGVSIVLLTVVVKALTLPLSLKQYKSMKAMRDLAPELKELQEKYGSDPVKLNQERQSLLTRKGVNPLAGCFPLIVQFPVWIALYAMLGTAVELYHEPFLWLKDLTKPDRLFILPIALAVLQWLHMHIQPTTTGDPQQQAVMKWMMPLVFLVMMWFLPSGLGIYMFASTTLSLVQSYIQLGPARREAKVAASS